MNVTLPSTELLSPRQLAARWGLSKKTSNAGGCSAPDLPS